MININVRNVEALNLFTVITLKVLDGRYLSRQIWISVNRMAQGSEMENQIRKIINTVTGGTVLGKWEFDIQVHPLPSNALAEIRPEWDLRRARITVSPEFDHHGAVDLGDLIRHELGHCATDDIFEIIKGLLPDNPDAIDRLEDMLATRIGMMLLATTEQE